MLWVYVENCKNPLTNQSGAVTCHSPSIQEFCRQKKAVQPGMVGGKPLDRQRQQRIVKSMCVLGLDKGHID